MKLPSYRSVRTTVRLKPGRILRFPPSFLKHAGWHAGDVLLAMVVGDHLKLLRLPDEHAWRLDRLRQRIGSTVRRSAASETIRTYGDYLALCQRDRCRTRASNRNFIFSKES